MLDCKLLSGLWLSRAFAWVTQGHQFHPDSQEKQEWILELSFGNAGPSSQANLYKSMPRSAFKSMSLWMNRGVQKVEPPESHWLLANPSLRGPQPRDDALGCAKELWPFQILTLRMPLACRRQHLGGSEPMHRARQFGQSFLGCIFKERPAQMDMEKLPASFHWSFLFLLNLAAFRKLLVRITGEHGAQGSQYGTPI